MVSMTLMFVGIPLAAITPPPWNAIALLVPYFTSISVMILAPNIAQLLINRDRLIRPRIESTMNVYPIKTYHWWLQRDPMDEPETVLGYDRNPTTVINVADGRNSRYGRYSQIPIKLKDPFIHPKYGKIWKVYVRYKGEWATRMPHKGCKANRWGQYGLDHNHGDEATFYELRPKYNRDVPVKELTGYSYPVYKLKHAPGDLKVEEAEEDKEYRELTTPLPLLESINR